MNSKQPIILALLGLALVHLPLAAQQELPPQVASQGYADLVLFNGKIVSMDDGSSRPNSMGSVYQAMAVKGKRIMALGDNEDIRSLSGPGSRLVDLRGHTLIPGLINPHYHTYSSAGRIHAPTLGLVDESIKVSVVAEESAEATASKIRDTVVNAIRAQRIPKGQWITVDLREGPKNRPATNRTWLYMGRINRRQLDGAIQEHPVVIRVRSAGVFNAAAIAEFKKAFPDWEESTELENRPGAAADGYIAVPEFSALTYEYWWKDEPQEKIAEMMRLQGLDVIRAGMTTVATRLYLPRIIAAYHQLNREGQLPHRLAYYVETQRGQFWNLKTIREFYKGSGAPWTTHASGNEMLWLNGMCNEIWDSTQNEVCLGDDVDVPPEIRGRERCPGPGTKPWESIKAAVINGWRPVQSHATSSHGARLYIQMLEEAMREGGHSLEYMRSLRTTVEHAYLIGNVPDVIEGIKKFGIIIDVTTSYLREIPHNLKDYGEQIRPFIMPVKTWLEQGIRVTSEPDGLNPWRPYYRLVTREVVDAETKEKVLLQPEEAIDRVTALKMNTVWAAEYVMGENTIGTLEPGKFADFALLDRDYFTIPVSEIPDVKVTMTGLAGEIVFQAESPAP